VTITIIDQRSIEDERLSWAARGLFHYVLSRPDDWRILVDDLRRKGNLGRDGIYALLRELRRYGYMRYVLVRDEYGRIRGGIYYVHEVPYEPDPDKPNAAEPDTAEPDMVQPDTARPCPAIPDALPNTETNLRTTTITTESGSGGGCDEQTSDLEFPRDILPAERAKAETLLQGLPARLAQQVLDEWAGIIAAGAIRSSPLGCLRGLTTRARAGTFTPQRGPRVAHARESRQRAAAAQAQTVSQMPKPGPVDEDNPLVRRILDISKRTRRNRK
jgi:hypothetical protein